MNRIAVVSDIHGNLPALLAVVGDLTRKRVDKVVNLGDHLSGPLWPKETAVLLMKQPWVHLIGNMDESLVSRAPERLGLSDSYAIRELGPQELEWLRALPAISRAENSVLAFHGTPSNNAEYLLESIEHGRARLATPSEIEARLGTSRASVMLCGHSHVPRVVTLVDGSVIVNPGSVGLPAYTHDQPEQHIIESGSPHARYAILDMADSQCKVQLIAVPYGWQEAAAQARRNNRNDWAIGLESGFMKE